MPHAVGRRELLSFIDLRQQRAKALRSPEAIEYARAGDTLKQRRFNSNHCLIEQLKKCALVIVPRQLLISGACSDPSPVRVLSPYKLLSPAVPCMHTGGIIIYLTKPHCFVPADTSGINLAASVQTSSLCACSMRCWRSFVEMCRCSLQTSPMRSEPPPRCSQSLPLSLNPKSDLLPVRSWWCWERWGNGGLSVLVHTVEVHDELHRDAHGGAPGDLCTRMHFIAHNATHHRVSGCVLSPPLCVVPQQPLTGITYCPFLSRSVLCRRTSGPA